MGVVYEQMGNSDKAMECYNDALDTHIKVFGHNHPHVADTKHK